LGWCTQNCYWIMLGLVVLYFISIDIWKVEAMSDYHQPGV
jgi:hypothetical protein